MKNLIMLFIIFITVELTSFGEAGDFVRHLPQDEQWTATITEGPPKNGPFPTYLVRYMSRSWPDHGGQR